MAAPSTQEPPYRHIVAEIRDRIISGELAPGDRVPSTRQIMQKYGVAMATATKALTALRHEHLVRAQRGSGTVVAASRPEDNRPRGLRSRRPRDADQEITTQHVVSTAIDIADREGLDALTLRRVAADLDVATMTLYRYVDSKSDLILLMSEKVFAEVPLPEEPAEDWRSRLEYACRLQWTLHRRHPWLVRTISLTRPRPAPNAMAHTEWTLRMLAGLDLDAVTMLYIHITTFSYVRGFAINFELEAEAEENTGITGDQWLASQDTTLSGILASGSFPMLHRTTAQLGGDFDLDRIFEFGLTRVLDGIQMLITKKRRE